MSNFIERGKTDCWPFMGATDDAPNAGNKMACDNPKCCNPRHVVHVEESESDGVDRAEDFVDNIDVDQIKDYLNKRQVQYRSNASIESLKQLFIETWNGVPKS